MIKLNNSLIYADKHDCNEVYSKMKKHRGDSKIFSTNQLHTPVVTCRGEGILEKYNEGQSCYIKNSQ